MRDIKFRGKTKEGEWFYGDLVINRPSQSYRIVKDFALVRPSSHTKDGFDYCGGVFNDVIPETIGQFTGLKDKNGVEIYEGDHFGEPNYPVQWDEDCGAFMHEGELMHYADCWEVIGNIHDK